MLKENGAPRMSVEVIKRRMAGVFGCRFWNGTDEKFAGTSLLPLTIAIVASGCAIASVMASSLL